jgi:hypothetical protein
MRQVLERAGAEKASFRKARLSMLWEDLRCCGKTFDVVGRLENAVGRLENAVGRPSMSWKDLRMHEPPWKSGPSGPRKRSGINAGFSPGGRFHFVDGVRRFILHAVHHEEYSRFSA